MIRFAYPRYFFLVLLLELGMDRRFHLRLHYLFEPLQRLCMSAVFETNTFGYFGLVQS
jgi:hypothetical protein